MSILNKIEDILDISIIAILLLVLSPLVIVVLLIKSIFHILGFEVEMNDDDDPNVYYD